MNQLMTVNGLATETGVDRRTVAKRLKACGCEPAEIRGGLALYDYEEVYPYVMGDDDSNNNFLLDFFNGVIQYSNGVVLDRVGKTLADKLAAAGVSGDQASEIVAAAAVASVDAWREIIRTGEHLRYIYNGDADSMARDVLIKPLAPKRPTFRYRYPKPFFMPLWLHKAIEQAGLPTDYLVASNDGEPFDEPLPIGAQEVGN